MQKTLSSGKQYTDLVDQAASPASAQPHDGSYGNVVNEDAYMQPSASSQAQGQDEYGNLIGKDKPKAHAQVAARKEDNYLVAGNRYRYSGPHRNAIREFCCKCQRPSKPR